MINYSTCMRGNPTDKDAAKKAYANAQYSQVMWLRSLKVCELEYDAEGKIITIEGLD